MTSAIRTCSSCGKPKCLDQYETVNGAYRSQCRKCRYQAKVKRKLEAALGPKIAAVKAPKARHPWELLGADCRPNWSKL